MTQPTSETTVRWCVETDDRIGMVRDVVACVAESEGNVEAMEVVAQILYVRFRIPAAALHRLGAAVAGIPGVRTIVSIDKLPFEADEERLIRRVLHQEEAITGLTFANLIYRSPPMKAVVYMAEAAARGDMPVLITGESGTGKELLARAVHTASRRHDRRFVPVNCAALPESLLESELFGYADGAFTGAKRGGRPGLFEVADGGTLFLDEIGELTPAVQAKLLRVLEDGEVRRIGATDSIHVDARIIAATNRDLQRQMESGQFRDDLYYRLHVMPLHIPPLRNRKDDVVLLATQFLERTGRKLECQFTFTETSRQALLQYDYPGNVRELQNIIERACYLVDGTRVEPQHLMLPVSDKREYSVAHMESDKESNTDLRSRVKAYERRVILTALTETGSLRAAARRLGVTHTTLSNKLRQSGEAGE